MCRRFVESSFHCIENYQLEGQIRVIGTIFSHPEISTQTQNHKTKMITNCCYALIGNSGMYRPNTQGVP